MGHRVDARQPAGAEGVLPEEMCTFLTAIRQNGAFTGDSHRNGDVSLQSPAHRVVVALGIGSSSSILSLVVPRHAICGASYRIVLPHLSGRSNVVLTQSVSCARTCAAMLFATRRLRCSIRQLSPSLASGKRVS
jgi:hypothetical protein